MSLSSQHLQRRLQRMHLISLFMATSRSVYSFYIYKSRHMPGCRLQHYNIKDGSFTHTSLLKAIENRRQDLDLCKIPNRARAPRSPIRSRPKGILHALQRNEALVKAVPDLVDRNGQAKG
jgi:hypothetical protein